MVTHRVRTGLNTQNLTGRRFSLLGIGQYVPVSHSARGGSGYGFARFPMPGDAGETVPKCPNRALYRAPDCRHAGWTLPR